MRPKPALARLQMFGVAAIIAALAVMLLPSWAQAAPSEDMVGLVNAHRASHSLSALRVDPTLGSIARRHAAAMADQGGIYHNPALRSEMTAAVSGWTRGGENVGVGPSTSAVHRAFLASPTHRRNIESDRFDAIGIGAVRDSDGRVYFAQVFADMSKPVMVEAIVTATPVPIVTPAPTAPPAPTPVPVAAPTIAPLDDPISDAPGSGSRVAVFGFVDALLSGLTAIVARSFRRA